MQVFEKLTNLLICQIKEGNHQKILKFNFDPPTGQTEAVVAEN
jgi:hypothetical protein